MLNLNFTRIKALIKKEIIQIKRDKSSLLIAFVLPVFLTFIFGYAISIDTNKVRLIIVNEAPQSVENTELVSAFVGSKFIDLKLITSSHEEAQNLLLAQKASAIVTIPSDFNKKISKQNLAQIFLATDASDPNTASFAAAYVSAIANVYVDNLNRKMGIKTVSPINIEQRFWYNEALKADHLLNIGSIGFVLSIAGTLLTALVVARDWERGSMEFIIASPATSYEIILGKVLPYLLLGLGSFFITFVCILLMFGAPFKGSLLIFFVIGFFYLVLTTGLGLLISTASKNQFVAAQGALLISMVPTIMLSGLIYEINNMPKIMQFVTNIVPAKYLIDAMKTLFMMGNEWSILLPNILGILVISGAIYFGVVRKTRKSLE
jgi:ABC-2 type transport system permease protein